MAELRALNNYQIIREITATCKITAKKIFQL